MYRLNGPARDLFFSQKHFLQEKHSKLVKISDFDNFFLLRKIHFLHGTLDFNFEVNLQDRDLPN